MIGNMKHDERVELLIKVGSSHGLLRIKNLLKLIVSKISCPVEKHP